MSNRCRACVAGVEHCHGTVVHHALTRPECTEPDCRTPEVVHVFAIDCEAIGCTCAELAQPIGSADSSASWTGSTSLSG